MDGYLGWKKKGWEWMNKWTHDKWMNELIDARKNEEKDEQKQMNW